MTKSGCGKAQALAAEPIIETSRLLTHEGVIVKLSEKITEQWKDTNFSHENRNQMKHFVNSGTR